MNRQEAGEIRDALYFIETGKAEEGVRVLRRMLAVRGERVPEIVVEAREARPRRKSMLKKDDQ
jgi:hypothetical protein